MSPAQGRDMRWYSDGLEIQCDSGQTVTATFTHDCCDREVMAWRAYEGQYLPDAGVLDVDRGGGETFWHGRGDPYGTPAAVHQRQRRRVHRSRHSHAGRSLGLAPVNTRVYSPQSNGMAESLAGR